MTFWGRKDQTIRAKSEASPIIEQPAQAVFEPKVSEVEVERWRGYIDSVNRDTIVGWCCDADNPDTSLAVEAIASNGRRLVTMASIFRQDVREAGWGSGNHGFEINTTKLNLKNDTVTVRFFHNKVLIGSGPLVVDSKHALLSGDLPQGYLVLMQQLAIDVQAQHAELQASAKT